MSKGQSAEDAKTSVGFSIFTSLKTNGSDPNIEVWKKFVSFEKNLIRAPRLAMKTLGEPHPKHGKQIEEQPYWHPERMRASSLVFF